MSAAADDPSEPIAADPGGIAAAVTRAGQIYQAFLAGLEQRRVAPDVDREVLRGMFRGTLGSAGVGLQGMLDDIEASVLPHAMTTPHPCYAGLVNSSPLPAAPVADLIVSMLNNNSGAFHQSPASTTAEEEVVRAFAAVLGYPAGAVGLMLPGGTFANLHGLMLARTRCLPGWREDGPGEGCRPRIYTSTSAHFSVARTAGVLGLGEANVLGIPGHGRGAVDVGALAARIRADRQGGATPVAVVATIGTTGTGAVDDVAALAEVCSAEDVWLHVDACYGGAAALLDENAAMFRGIGSADSVSIDPHKWFFMPITAGLVLTRHAAVERQAFGLDVSYIPTDAEPEAFLRGVPTSRRGSGLAVWATLRAHGWEPIRAAVRRNIAQSRQLEDRLAAAGFRVLPGGELSIACARFEPPGLDSEALDRLQWTIASRVMASGLAWFATTRHEEETWLRFNLVNLHTRDRHVEIIVDAVRAAAEAEVRAIR